MPRRQSAPRQTLVNGKNSGRSNSPETNESGNYEENRRAAAIREEHADRAKNRSDYTGNNSHPQHRRHRRDVTGDNLNLALSDRDHRAIVIIGNLAAVQPRMERRARLGRRHQQPERQRQPRRGRVQTPPPTSIYGTSISQIICNIAKRMPLARVCLDFSFTFPNRLNLNHSRLWHLEQMRRRVRKLEVCREMNRHRFQVLTNGQTG